jgi:pheromone alpha factor receptor
MDNPYNSTFDPYGQDITILAPNGIDVITLPLQTVFQLQGMATHTGIMFGVQIGMVAILLLVLAMITKQGKHRSLVFILNVLSLVFIFTRNIMACFGVTGPFYNYYNWVAGYYEGVTPAKNLSIAVECMSFFVDLIIELSLMFQVRIVCCTLSSRWRSLITFASVLVVLMAVGGRFALMVINIKDNIAIVGQSTEEQWKRLNQVGSASNICLMISIIFFSLIFCLKLAHAIRQRRKMGIKQFGPMQIIFVMGCQTLIIPGEHEQRVRYVFERALTSF